MSTRLHSLRAAIGFIALTLATASVAVATPAGTVGTPAPGPISVTVGGTTKFTASNFQFLNTAASGGGNLYQAEDITIDIATGGGLTGLLTFAKNPAGPTPGVVFLANPGNASAFTFSYDLTVTSVVPGIVSYTSLANSIAESHLANGLASLQTIVSPINCQVSTANTSNSVVLAGQPTTISVGNIVSVTGNSGNTSILTFTNLLGASFTPIPEPSSLAVLGLGLAAFVRSGRRA